MSLKEILQSIRETTEISAVDLSTLRGIASIFGVNSECEPVDNRQIAALDADQVPQLIAQARERRGLKTLSGGAARNYTALARQVIRYAQKEIGDISPPALSVTIAKQSSRSHRSHRKHVPPPSQAAIAELDSLVTWKTARSLPPREVALRQKPWRAETANHARAKLLSYWGRLEIHLGRSSTQVERYSAKLYEVVVGAYLDEKADAKSKASFPGFDMALQWAGFLETACREFVPALHPGLIEEISKFDGADTVTAFEMYKEHFRQESRRIAVPPGKSAIGITRKDLYAAGKRAIADAEKIAARRGARWRDSEFRSHRAGLVLMLLAEWGFRIRNVAAAEWGKNFRRRPDGQYEFEFRGAELKVEFRGQALNVHSGTFNKTTSAEIDRWHEFLETRYGKGICRKVSYVFPTLTDVEEAQFRLQPSHQYSPLVEQGFAWLAYSPTDRETAAREAANNRDFDGLWGLTVAHAELSHGRRPCSETTLRRDKHSIQTILSHAAFNPLLTPAADAWEQLAESLRREGIKTATIATKRVAVGKLFAALRWANATAADPLSDERTANRTGNYTHNRISARDRLRDDTAAITETYLGVRLTPHRTRNVMVNDAKNWGQRSGADAWSAAAYKLNNSVSTVIRSYNVQDTSRIDEFDAELED